MESGVNFLASVMMRVAFEEVLHVLAPLLTWGRLGRRKVLERRKLRT